MAQTITIGRDPLSDIKIDNSFERVSNRHADLTYTDDGRIQFTDHSTNGTIINDRELHHDSAYITPDHTVKLAGDYTLIWENVFALMPDLARAQSKRTRRVQPNVYAAQEPEAQPAPQPASYEQPASHYDAPAQGRGTERFDRGFDRQSDQFNSTNRMTGSQADPVAEPAIEEHKAEPRRSSAKHRRRSSAHRRGASRSTLVLCIVAFIAIMAILAFTVFDDVVKNIM